MENQELNNNTYCIYCHTSPSGKRYIGQTKHGDNPNKRWINGKHHSYQENPYFSNAINKYGWENFTHEILEENLTPEQANEREEYWIAYYDTTNHEKGYNILKGGLNYEPPMEVRKQISESLIKYYEEHEVSEETRKKISEANKGKTHPFSEESKQKLSQSLAVFYNSEEGAIVKKQASDRAKKRTGELNPFFGKHHSEGVKSVIAEKHRGKHASEETKKKQSDAQSGEKNSFYGKHHSEETKQKIREQQHSKKVLCVETGVVYQSSHAVESELGFAHISISRCCNGKQKTCMGYHWKYYNKEMEVAA